MKAILVNYNYTPDWLFNYPELDYYLFDRSDSKEYLKDFPPERVMYTRNVGNVDYDKLAYLVDYYDNLPAVFLWGKSNLFKYVDEESFKDALTKREFTPLLKQDHKTYKDKLGTVCYYERGMYHERNDSWYLNEVAGKYVHNWTEWAQMFQLPNPRAIPFPPGGNFILTKERVHRYNRDMYLKMMETLDYTQLPGEAQCCERTYYLLWR